MIHSAWGTGTFSDAIFGTGADCLVSANAALVAVTVAYDRMSLSTNISAFGDRPCGSHIGDASTMIPAMIDFSETTSARRSQF
jgi:hypothetical protein